MELSQTPKTIQEMQQQIQSYVFDFNVHQQSLSLSPDESLDSAAFPGLKGRALSKALQEAAVGQPQRDGINEIVMLQQRTVLQVGKYC